MKKMRFLCLTIIILLAFSAFFYGCESAVLSNESEPFDDLHSVVDGDPSFSAPTVEEETPLLPQTREAPIEDASPAEPSPEAEIEESDPRLEESEGKDSTPDVQPTAAEPAYRYIEPTTDLESYLAACAKTAVNVRKGAGTGYAVLKTLTAGDSLPYLWREGEWIAVWTGERVGYLSSAYAYVTQTNQRSERVIRAGLGKIGTPYLWGAPRILDENGNRSPYFTGASFDCSSFVQYCYYIGAGIKLGNYTGSQADHTVGVRIDDYADLRRGDFYFTGNDSISHVVIYLGGGYLLQTYSANGGPVSVTTDGRWKGKFISGRRPNLTIVDQFR